MRLDIDLETFVEGTPVGKNCRRQPTADELNVTWKALLYVAGRLKKAAGMVEVLRVSFEQHFDGQEERVLEATFKILFDFSPPWVNKTEVNYRIDLRVLLGNPDAAMETFLRDIKSQVGSMAQRVNRDFAVLSDIP